MTNGMSLTVIQLNDSHAYCDLHQELFWQGAQAIYRPAGGFARIATIVKKIRAANQGPTLFCDSGDTLHGTHPAQQTQGEALIPILNSLEIDAMTAHWEFAYGPEIFKQRAAKLNYPMLAINVYEESSGELFFPPFSVKEIGGFRIGLVGIASNIIDKAMPPAFSKGLKFTLGREELPSIISDLRTQEKVDLIVLISHLGFPQDMKLVSEVQGIDVCLSGHTHHRLYKPVLKGKTLIIQSGSHASFLGRLDLEIEGGKVADYRHELIEVTADTDPDPMVADLVQQALAPFQEELSTVVGETVTALNRATMLESTMDNFLLQATLESTGAQLAFSNGWRYGAPVIPGEVTMNDLYNIIPMNPPISTVELTGEEIVTMMEENLERTFACDPYNQMGGYVKRGLGFHAYIKIENPTGQRVQRMFVGDELIQPGRSYPTAFVTEQGVAKKYGRNRQKHTVKSIEALRAYLTRHRTLNAELRGTYTAV
ncbi:MAG TPA: bifunctional metallophosphatase/5'-nucleotidase [Anaerolineaceae bacterium]|nr:bifunctional metallophosphatase/5'-nucleotidase [Anaerolineaceae bacterium]